MKYKIQSVSKLHTANFLRPLDARHHQLLVRDVMRSQKQRLNTENNEPNTTHGASASPISSIPPHPFSILTKLLKRTITVPGRSQNVKIPQTIRLQLGHKMKLSNQILQLSLFFNCYRTESNPHLFQFLRSPKRTSLLYHHRQSQIKRFVPSVVFKTLMIPLDNDQSEVVEFWSNTIG